MNEEGSNGGLQKGPFNRGLGARYKKALAVILTTKAELKDDTYLQHLLTESLARLTTLSQLRDCGIIGFIQAVLENPSSDPALVTLALQFFENAIKVSNATNVSNTTKVSNATNSLHHQDPAEEAVDAVIKDFIKNMLNKHLSSLMQSNDPNVISALFSTINAVLLDSTYAETFIQDRHIHEFILSTLSSSKSYHVVNLSAQSFLSILAILTTNAKNADPGNAQVNYRKIRQNLLVEYFEKMSNPTSALEKRLLVQLKYFLRNTSEKELKAVLFEFILTNLDFTYLEVNVKDFCALMVESSLQIHDMHMCHTLFSHSDPDVQLSAVYEMSKYLGKRPEFARNIQGYIEKNQNNPDFVKLLNKPSFAENISVHSELRAKILDISADILSNNSDFCRESSSKVILAVLRFAKEMAAIGHLENLPKFLAFVREILGRFLGVPDDVKMACCDLMAVICSKSGDYKESHNMITSELVSLLGYAAVSGTSTWQLKDSSIQCLCVVLQNRKLKLSAADHEVVNNVVNSASQDKMSYVRTASYSLQAAYVDQVYLTQQQESDLCSKIEATMLCDQEAIVRREVVDFLSVWALNISSENLPSLCNILLHVLTKDFDWEVKLKSANFWRKILERSRSECDRILFLERIGATSAIILGLSDYELPVKQAFREVVESLMTELELEQSVTKFKKLDLASSGKSVGDGISGSHDDFEDEDVDDVIEGIVEAGDGELVKSLLTEQMDVVPSLVQVARRSITDLVEFVHQQEMSEGPQEDVLDSILEDIVSSVSDIGLVEVVDCY